MTPRCKDCHERLVSIKLKDDEWTWWCETCHDSNAEPEEEGEE